MKIAIDFDDVIVDTVSLFLVEWNTRHPHGYVKRNQINNWNMPQVLNAPSHVIRGVFETINYSDVKAVEGAVKSIRALLSLGHQVLVLSSNPRYDDIRKWLSQNGLQKVGLFAGIGHKADFLRTHNVDVFIEDRPSYLKASVTVGVKTIRFETPWNVPLQNGCGNEWGRNRKEFTAAGWENVMSILARINQESTIKALGEQLKSVPLTFKLRTSNLADVMIAKSTPKVNEERTLGNPSHRASDTDTVVTNAKGAKQTYIAGRYDLLPALAVKEVAAVLGTGAEKYGVDNWKDLEIDEVLNHVYAHLLNYQQVPNKEELAHAATRILMALQLHLESK